MCQLIATMVFIFFLTFSPARAERAWEGHIHLVDANINLVFEGYDYGTWDDVGRLEFPSRGRPRDGAWSVRFRIAPDEDNPLRSTIVGTTEIVVDQQKAVLQQLRFVRKHKHAKWQIDPEIIQELKTNSMQSPETHKVKKPDVNQDGKSTDSEASTVQTADLLFDIDFTRPKIPDETLAGCDLKGVSIDKSGLFLNGQYEFGNDGYRAVFPIEQLDYSQFSFCLDFQGLDFKPAKQRSSTWVGQLLGSRDVAPHTNLITGGTSYRWFGLKVRDGHLWLTLNNGELEYAYKSAVVDAKKWHSVVGSFDLDNRVIQLMLDGELIATENLPKDFALNVIGTPEEQNDKQLTLTNYSNSECFHGHVARLTVLDTVLDQQELANWYDARDEFRESLQGFASSSISAVSILYVLAVITTFCILLVIIRMKLQTRSMSGERN